MTLQMDNDIHEHKVLAHRFKAHLPETKISVVK